MPLPPAARPSPSRPSTPKAGDDERRAGEQRRHRPLMRKPQQHAHAAQQHDEQQQRHGLRGRRHRRVVAPHRIDPESGFRKPLGHIGGPPAGRLEPDAHLVRPRASAPHVSRQRGIDLEVGPQRVEAAQRRASAVDARLVVALFLEGAEQAVPHDQDAAVVAVEVTIVHCMVHAVVRRRAEPAVEPAQLVHLLGVHPELVQQVDQRDGAEHQRRHADQRHRQIEQPPQQRTAGGLAQRGGEVVVLALVVHHVRGPEDAHAVPGAMQPVVAQVVHQQGTEPHRNRVGRQAPQRDPFVDEHVQADGQQAREQAHQLAHHAQADAGHRVVQPVGVAAAGQANGQLDRDRTQKDGRGQNDDLGGCHRCR